MSTVMFPSVFGYHPVPTRVTYLTDWLAVGGLSHFSRCAQILKFSIRSSFPATSIGGTTRGEHRDPFR